MSKHRLLLGSDWKYLRGQLCTELLRNLLLKWTVLFYDSQELRALQFTGIIGGAVLKTQKKPGNEFCLFKALNSKEDRFEKIVALTSHIGGHLHTGTHTHTQH